MFFGLIFYEIIFYVIFIYYSFYLHIKRESMDIGYTLCVLNGVDFYGCIVHSAHRTASTQKRQVFILQK